MTSYRRRLLEIAVLRHHIAELKDRLSKLQCKYMQDKLIDVWHDDNTNIGYIKHIPTGKIYREMVA